MKGNTKSLSVMEIKELTPTSYVEKRQGSIFIENAKGPHTLNLSPDLKNCFRLL